MTRKAIIVVVAIFLTLLYLAFVSVSAAGEGMPASSLPAPVVSEATYTQVPSPTVTATPTSTPTLTPHFFDYEVKSSDTLEAIAQAYHLSIYDLTYINGFDNPNLYTAGKTIKIPYEPFTIANTSTRGKQIRIVLSEQMLYAFEDGQLIANIQISSGKAETPTVIGEYRTYYKLERAHMTGPGYDDPSVPWTMYFYLGYGIHGAGWHNNFGTPVSHGCVNLPVSQAEWLYRWAPLGIPVEVIP